MADGLTFLLLWAGAAASLVLLGEAVVRFRHWRRWRRWRSRIQLRIP